MKEKWTCGSHLKIIIIIIVKREELEQKETERACRRESDKIFIFLFISFSDLRKSDRRFSSGQERKVLYVTRATCGYQKHGILLRIQVKFRKILIFSFSLIYDILMVKIFRIKS